MSTALILGCQQPQAPKKDDGKPVVADGEKKEKKAEVAPAKNAAGNNHKTLDDLVEHFKANGVAVDPVQPSDSPQLGIGESRGIYAKGFGLLLTKYDTTDRVAAKRLAVLTEQGYDEVIFGKIPIEVNGSFTLSVIPTNHAERKNLERIFKKF